MKTFAQAEAEGTLPVGIKKHQGQKSYVVPVFQKVGNPDPKEEAKRRKMWAELMKRNGKTLRDHKTGAWVKRFKNQAERAEWSNDPDRDVKNFPYKTCNGKKNRFHS